MVSLGLKPNFADACCISTDVLNGDFGRRFICWVTMEDALMPFLQPTSNFVATLSTTVLDVNVNFFTGSLAYDMSFVLTFSSFCKRAPSVQYS